MKKECKSVSKITCLILIAFLGLINSSFKTDSQNLYTTKSGYFAAVDEESYDNMMLYIVDKDIEALNKLIDKGKVIQLKKGIKVYLVKHSWGKVIIRPKGYEIKLWTVSEAIE